MTRPLHGALALTATALLVACGNAGSLDETCSSNSDCAETELCGTGFCGGFGICIPRPEACDEEDLNLVCGCDGLTYPNADCAALAGVRLQEISACVCSDNSGCVDGQYCALDDSCENPGQCIDRPETCDPVSEPVCGCDFMTYDNACDAASAGVRVSAQASCECQSDGDCADEEFCDASVCDGPGFCALRNDPECQPAGPVTGCNGVRYGNRCDAAQAGVRVRPN
jgi:hypothetical protein